MSAYYNEIDLHAAEWLRNLIAAGHIAPGDVDTRSIADVRPDDLRGYTQCHFFAGIGGWSYALRLAGVPDSRSVWTGSCPCQPFSAAGKQRGSDDERHLWPAFFRLIRECRPGTVFGEQVAGAAGYAWWDHVAADLEGEGYAAAAADLGAHSVGAPHLRQRLYWVAHADGRHASAEGLQRGWKHRQQPAHGGACVLADSHAPGLGQQRLEELLDSERPAQRDDADRRGADGGDLADSAPGGQRVDWGASGQAGHAALGDATGWMADTTGPRPQGSDEPGQRVDAQREAAERAGSADGRMADAYGRVRRAGQSPERELRCRPGSVESAGMLDAWSDLEWIACSDGKARPTQPGLFPLAHGLPAGLVRGSDQRLAPDSTAEGRVIRLRGYGNAIVPQVAAAFVRAA